MLFSVKVYALYDDEPRIVTFFKNYYTKPEHVQNQNFINLNYGLAFYDKFRGEEFANHYQLEGTYGFYRIDDRMEHDNIFRFASDYAFLGNVSTNFKTFDNESPGLDTDTWRFGFGISDGFGYDFGENSRFYLLHGSDWIWSRMDFANTEVIPYILAKTDEKFKFGNRFHGGFRLQLYKGLNFDMKYEHTLIYSAHVVPKWLGMWLFDNIAQRWFDYFEPEWYSIFGRNYPWIRFLYKNTLSFLLYQIRESEMYFPFESSPALPLTTYRVGFTYVFE
jgi:hypothetical protein